MAKAGVWMSLPSLGDGEYGWTQVLGEQQRRLRGQLDYNVRGLEYPASRWRGAVLNTPQSPAQEGGILREPQRCQSGLPMPLCF